ncbi:MAG: hypothetical protein ACR2JE_15010 [Acidobacteriaceae bacterium]
MCKHPIPALLSLSLFALLLSGCASTPHTFASSGSAYAVASGNWAITPQLSASTSGQAVPALPTASGALTRAADGSLSGTFRLSPAPACLGGNVSSNLSLSGATDATGRLHLTSQPVEGAIWSLTGQLSADGKTLTASTTTISGGACPVITASAAGTFYTPISGTYTGSFTDIGGVTIPVSTTLTQTSAPDPNGQYHLSGNGTFPSNPCFTSPAITDSLVTGNTLSAAYSQQQGGVTSSVTATGTFNADATVLTISAYSVVGGDCDGDTGAGLLTTQ